VTPKHVAAIKTVFVYVKGAFVAMNEIFNDTVCLHKTCFLNLSLNLSPTFYEFKSNFITQ